ncbi:hypothetical protein [Mycolicibacterium sp. HS_4_1]
MGGPNLHVDNAELESAARKLASLSSDLTNSAVVHGLATAEDQPSGTAAAAVTAAADHVAGVCAGDLKAFGDKLAQAAKSYSATDSDGGQRVLTTMHTDR